MHALVHHYLRGGMKSLIFHVTCIPTPVDLHHQGRDPILLKLKNGGDPQGFASLSSLVLITNHNHTTFLWGSSGFTLENRRQSLLWKAYGNKSDDSAFLSVHVILSYLLEPLPLSQIIKGDVYLTTFTSLAVYK